MSTSYHAVTTGVSRQLSSDGSGDADPVGCNRGRYVTFSSDSEIRVVDRFRIWDFLQRERPSKVVRGESLPFGRSGIRRRQCTMWRDGGSAASEHTSVVRETIEHGGCLLIKASTSERPVE